MSKKQRNFLYLVVALAAVLLLGPYFGLHLISAAPGRRGPASVESPRRVEPQLYSDGQRDQSQGDSSLSEIEELLER